jgi:hypothetical protein
VLITQADFGAQGAISIEVIDGAGRLVSIEQLGTLAPGFHKHGLDVSALPAGVYTVHIQNDNNEQGIKRLLVAQST